MRKSSDLEWQRVGIDVASEYNEKDHLIHDIISSLRPLRRAFAIVSE